MKEMIAALRADHTALGVRVGNLEHGIETRHAENRKSIHELRNLVQGLLDSFHQLDLKFARAYGYALGAGAVMGLVVAVVVEIVHHVWK